MIPLSFNTHQSGSNVMAMAPEISTNWDVRLLGLLSYSLPFAVQDGPPVVRPGQESSLGGADAQVFVVAGGEEDVLPRWFGFHTLSGHMLDISIKTLRNYQTHTQTHTCLIVWSNTHQPPDKHYTHTHCSSCFIKCKGSAEDGCK